MKALFSLLLCFLSASCVTFDVDKNARDSGQDKNYPEISPMLIFPETKIVIVEKPVFVPESDPPARPPAAGPQAVKEALSSGVKKPSDYSHAAMVYDYDRDFVYEIYAQPLRVCDIVLEPGERAVEAPFVSDSERWILGAGVSYENGTAVQHIYVKPAASGQEASLIINTDRRVYYVILRSYKDAHMPIIRWRYFSGLPANYHSPQPENGSGGAGADPRFISFNYRITYGLFKKPAWLPTLVFDDGSKTYVTFPELVLQRELPSVFENRSGVLNYRVSGNVIIIDKLIENITVKIERNEITIAKKRGADVR